MLSVAAAVPASEKFRTQVTETTVEARQRLNALSTCQRGDTSVGRGCGTARAARGSTVDSKGDMNCDKFEHQSRS